jgi:dUTP pyrophosphatase
MTKQRFIYLASPIDQSSGVGNPLRDRAITEVENKGMALYTPHTAFKAKRVQTGPEIAQINNAALQACTGVLVVMPDGVVSMGVPMEIERAASRGKPVAIAANADSWELASSRFKHLAQFAYTPTGVEQAVIWLSQQEGVSEIGPAEQATLPVAPVNQDDGIYFLPRRIHADDAGLDLYVARTTTVEPGEFVDVPAGVAVELPEWSWGLITGRSSTLRKRRLMVNPGIIDAGYRGPLFAGVFNLAGETVTVEQGERIAQLIIIENSTRRVRPEWVKELSPHARGESGFGSSGA